MDDRLLSLERSYASNPDNRELRLRLVQALARGGRLYDARKLLRLHIASAAFDLEELELFAKLGRQAGFVASGTVCPSALTKVYGRLNPPREKPLDLELEVGFVGPPGAGALVSVFALATLFGRPVEGLVGSGLADPRSLRRSVRAGQESNPLELPQHGPSETSFEFTLPLVEPWALSRYRITGIRVTTVPTASHRVMLRRRILRSLNGLAFVPDTRADGTGETNEALFRRLDREFQELWGTPLSQFRVVLQYLEPAERSLRRALAVALGLRFRPRIHADVETTSERAPRPAPLFSGFRVGRDHCLAHEGVLDSFALLVSRAVRDLPRH